MLVIAPCCVAGIDDREIASAERLGQAGTGEAFDHELAVALGRRGARTRVGREELARLADGGIEGHPVIGRQDLGQQTPRGGSGVNTTWNSRPG